MGKPIYKSKTFWFMALFLIVNLAGLAGYSTYQFDSEYVNLVGAIVGLVGIILRVVTKGDITFRD